MAQAHLLNDVHSQLNATTVTDIVRPNSLSELRSAIRRAKQTGIQISTAGGRHCMGGQQFATESLHIDMTSLDRILDTDPVAGILHIEAGAEWPKVIAAAHNIRTENGSQWAIRQKQTGVDSVSLGGSVSVNAHGRGLAMQPIGDDIEELTLVDSQGEVVVCSRQKNHELFSLVVGGYGLFGVIYSVRLRLTPRFLVKRVVDIIDLDDAMNAVYRRADQGCVFGDFQFVIDAGDDNFLRRGVFACYKPSTDEETKSDSAADLTPDAWLELLKLAHEDKKSAFRLYSQHYLSTDGNHYWSDTHQLSTYLPSYADLLDTDLSGSAMKETLIIGEHYVPPDRLLDFMIRARDIFRAFGTEVIYGTIRAIQRDTVSFLPWARADYACVIFNLRTPHTDAGLQRTSDTFRALIDASNALDGSFFLAYHRFASPAQISACYPQFSEFLRLKSLYDPQQRFTSDWYTHYQNAFSEPAKTSQ